MKIRPVGAGLLHADGRTDIARQTDRQTWRSWYSLFAIFANSCKSILYTVFSSSHCSHWSMGWTTNELGFNSRQERDISVLSTESRPILGFTQFSIRYVPGALSPGMKWPGRNSNNTPPSSGNIKNMRSQIFAAYNSLCLGAELSTWTLFQLPLTLQCRPRYSVHSFIHSFTYSVVCRTTGP
jgi:hypothetical protein